jgi:hypothetical protein
MNQSNVTMEGTYFDGEYPIARPAQLVFSGSEAVLNGSDISRTCDWQKLRVSPRSGRADRFILFPDGSQYQCADQPFLDRLPQEIRSEGPVAWLEDRMAVVLVGIAIIICVLLFGYFYGLPAAAESIAKRMPIETEQVLGDQALGWFDGNEWFGISQVDQEQQDSITKKFRRLHEGLSMSPYISLEFRNSEFIGPNAFAFPGGAIVVTDQMVGAAESEEEVLAVLAHEIGHVEMRHSIRMILQSSIVALAATTITADAASLSAAVAGLPVIIAQKKYSREFEAEADDFAFGLLVSNDIPPEAFANLMERLHEDSDLSQSLSFLSTHPVTSERIARARAGGPAPDERR